MITLLTVSGTAAPWFVGYPSESGFALTDPWLISRGQCFGPPEGQNWLFQGDGYPAAVFPMRPSVLNGWEECVRLLLEVYTSGPFVLDGYSQGAIVVCMVWREEILNPAGRLHHRLNDCLGVITYGNPMRSPGIAYGNTLLWGHVVPGTQDGYVTGGISGPNNLKPEECLFPDGHPLAGEPAVYDFANPGDLYASAPVGPTPWIKETTVGANETLVYEAIMDFDGSDLWAWTKKIFKIVTMPLSELWPLVQAIWNGLQFFSAGMNAPHWQYDSTPATIYLDKLGRQYA